MDYLIPVFAFLIVAKFLAAISLSVISIYLVVRQRDGATNLWGFTLLGWILVSSSLINDLVVFSAIP